MHGGSQVITLLVMQINIYVLQCKYSIIALATNMWSLMVFPCFWKGCTDKLSSIGLTNSLIRASSLLTAMFPYMLFTYYGQTIPNHPIKFLLFTDGILERLHDCLRWIIIFTCMQVLAYSILSNWLTLSNLIYPYSLSKTGE